jgi:regulator of cell morphogenesis and NO signaling
MFVTDVAGLDGDMLVTYILGNHHAVERRTLSALLPEVAKLARDHTATHPELHEVARRLDALAARIGDQMSTEERTLFPFVKDAAVAFRSGHRLPRSPYRSIEEPIREMAAEHARLRDVMSKIRRLTVGYRVLPNACVRYRDCMSGLAAFDDELREHARIEEQVLAPKLRMLLAPVYA